MSRRACSPDTSRLVLDFKNQLIILKTLHRLREQGISCIFNTHYPVHALQHADQALLLDKRGNICFGDTHTVITEHNLRAAFGVETVIGQIQTPSNEYSDVLAVDTIPESSLDESEVSLMSIPVNDELTRLAILSIIIESRESAEKINAMLHQYGQYIVGRMGMPYEKKNVNIICVILDAPETIISNLSGKLGQLHGVSVKATYSKK